MKPDPSSPSSTAIASLVLSGAAAFSSSWLGIPAIICGVIALALGHREGLYGAFAKAGIIVGLCTAGMFLFSAGVAAWITTIYLRSFAGQREGGQLLSAPTFSSGDMEGVAAILGGSLAAAVIIFLIVIVVTGSRERARMRRIMALRHGVD